MNLSEYIKERRGNGADLARALGVSRSQLANMASGVAAISTARCVQIEQATERRVMRWDLRPLDWHLNWPELIGRFGAPQLLPNAAMQLAEHGQPCHTPQLEVTHA